MKQIPKKYKILSLTLFLSALTGLMTAQTSIKSLDECIQDALSNNLMLKSGKVSIEKAKDMQGTAFNIEKTGISISQDPTSGGSPDNSISISQSFEFPTIYGARKNLLKAETNLEKNNYEVTKNELIKEVTSTYYTLVFAKKNISILLEQDSIYSKFLFLANAKFKAGESGRLEQMNAQRVYNENKIELQKAQKTYNSIQLSLQRWLNCDEWIEPREDDLSILNGDPVLNEFNGLNTPYNKVLESKREISEKNLSIAKQGFLPNFNFSLSNQMVIRGFNPYDVDRSRYDKGNFMGFEVGVSVPLFFWEQKSKTKAARREVEIARIEQEDALLSMQKQYRTFLNDYYKAKDALDYYRTAGIQQADDISRISQISYEKGEINYIEYIQNLKSAVEIQLQYVNAVNDYNQAVILLNYLQGKTNSL